MEKAPTPYRSKAIFLDPDVLSRNLAVGSGIPQKYQGHRKSSIPFIDRCPKVRFLRSVEPHGVNDFGSHKPQAESSNLKPILKKTAFPILVDMTQLQPMIFKGSSSCTNDDLEGCTNFVEQIIQHFSKAEREARGSMDILTFPVAVSTGAVEALARFEGVMVIAVLAIDKLKSYRTNSSKELLAKLTKLVEKLVKEITRSQADANKLLALAIVKYKQWAKLLNRKGEFRIEHARTKIPIYTKKGMPESVTLYEDVMEPEKRYDFDGSVRLYRTPNDIMLTTDTDLCMRYSEDVKDEVCSAIGQMVIEHVTDLIYYASLHLDVAIDTLNHKSFDDGYISIKNKITHIEFDAFFDPLCALELKTALGDIVSRKGELLNTCEHIVTYFKSMKKFTRTFLKFCKQSPPKKNQRDSTNGCFLGCKPISTKKLLSLLRGLGRKEFMISIPLAEAFENIIFDLPRDYDIFEIKDPPETEEVPTE